jgi:VanZ family protein
VRRLPRLLWTATIACWVVLAVLTHIPLDRYIPEEQKQWLQFLDKPEHFVAYFVLTTLLGCSLAASYPRRPHLAWLAVPIALAYGAFDEWTQEWVNRTCSLHDWYANAVGTFAAIAPILIFQRVLRRRAAGGAPTAPGPAVGDRAQAPTSG